MTARRIRICSPSAFLAAGLGRARFWNRIQTRPAPAGLPTVSVQTLRTAQGDEPFVLSSSPGCHLVLLIRACICGHAHASTRYDIWAVAPEIAALSAALHRLHALSALCPAANYSLAATAAYPTQNSWPALDSLQCFPRLTICAVQHGMPSTQALCRGKRCMSGQQCNRASRVRAAWSDTPPTRPAGIACSAACRLGPAFWFVAAGSRLASSVTDQMRPVERLRMWTSPQPARAMHILPS